MTHRIVVNVQTSETTIVEYTSEEQAEYDAKIQQELSNSDNITQSTKTEK